MCLLPQVPGTARPGSRAGPAALGGTYKYTISNIYTTPRDLLQINIWWIIFLIDLSLTLQSSVHVARDD